MRRHEIKDDQWARIEHLLPGKAGDPGVTAKDNRLFINAIFWIAKTGAPWSPLERPARAIREMEFGLSTIPSLVGEGGVGGGDGGSGRRRRPGMASH
jgi:hypothetical protein